MSSHLFVFIYSSKSDDSFPGQFCFTDSFETLDSYMHGYSFVKSAKYSLPEVSLSSVPLSLSFEGLFISSGLFIAVYKFRI